MRRPHDLIDRYPGTAGCRLDNGERENAGPALDLGGTSSRIETAATLWVRDEHGDATLRLGDNAALALYAGLGRLLVERGKLVPIEVLIPDLVRR